MSAWRPEGEGFEPGTESGRDGASRPKAAAFFDMDGTLVRSNLVQSFLFLTRHEPSLPESIAKTALGLAKIPVFAAVDRRSRTAFNEMLFAGLKGCFFDDLLEVAELHFEMLLMPNLFPGAPDLVARGKKMGLHQVIISGNLDFLVAPLVRHLGLDAQITNRLEVVDGVCTGRALKPLVASAAKAQMVREYAQAGGFDLSKSFAYSDSHSDLPMLSVVGRPAAVHPDGRLARVAREMRWPILSLDDAPSWKRWVPR
ncbi:MAG: HAD-IB family hydrolase [Myxococcota bacterium]